MLGIFPDPYEDELLYSVCARYSDRAKHPSQSDTFQALFGTRNIKAVLDLPGRIGELVARLPTSCAYSMDDLIEGHTLLPLFVCAISLRKADRRCARWHDLFKEAGSPSPDGADFEPNSTQSPHSFLSPMCIRRSRKIWGGLLASHLAGSGCPSLSSPSYLA